MLNIRGYITRITIFFIVLNLLLTLSCNSISYKLLKSFGGPITLKSLVGENHTSSSSFLKENNFYIYNKGVIPFDRIINVDLYEYQSNLVNFKISKEDLVIEETWKNGNITIHVWFINKIAIDNICYNSEIIQF